jgi:phage gp45-like
MKGLVEIVTDLIFKPDGVATGKGLASTDGEAHEIDPVVGWHFGFYSRPKDGARGVVLKADGQGNTSFLFAFRDKQYELSLEKGECGIQNAFNARILLNASGEVVVNDGTAKVARVGDKIESHTHAFALTANLTTGAVTGTITAHAGVPIAEGADKFKA